jgi:hypothetical protein
MKPSIGIGTLASSFLLITVAITGCGQNPHVVGAEAATEPAALARTPVGGDGSTTINIYGGDCRNELYNQTFEARKFRKSEAATLVLPYRSTDQHTIGLFPVGLPEYKADGEGFVRNSQVTFAVDLILPKRATVKEIIGLKLILAMTKVIDRGDRILDTELLCWLDQRMCSGQVFKIYGHGKNRDESWIANINPNFFDDARSQLVNENFSTTVMENEVKEVNVGSKILKLFTASHVVLDFADLFPDLKDKRLMSALYRRAVIRKDGMRVVPLHFVVADDTYVSDAKLEVQLTYDACPEGGAK